MPKLLTKSSATRSQKSQLRTAKMLAGLMQTAETEGDVIADLRSAAEYATKVANVLANEGEFKGHRISGARSNSATDNAAAFCHTVQVGNIPTSGKATPATPATETK